jgi:hypothetical protein
VALELEKKFRKPKRFVLRHAIRAFVFDDLTDEEAAEIAARPDVRHIEQDRVVMLEAIEGQTVRIHETESDFRTAVYDVTPPSQGAQWTLHKLKSRMVRFRHRKYHGESIA